MLEARKASRSNSRVVKAHRLTTAAHLAAAHVHLEVADGDDLLGGRSLPGPPQDGPHPSHQLAG